MKKEANLSKLVGGRFNKQGNLFTTLVLGGGKMTRSPYPRTRILKVYIEVLTGFSHIFSPDGFNSTLLSQGCILGTAPTEGKVGRVYIPRTGKGVRGLQLPGST